jgi:hypothetical protein
VRIKDRVTRGVEREDQVSMGVHIMNKKKQDSATQIKILGAKVQTSAMTQQKVIQGMLPGHFKNIKIIPEDMGIK